MLDIFNPDPDSSEQDWWWTTFYFRSLFLNMMLKKHFQSWEF